MKPSKYIENKKLDIRYWEDKDWKEFDNTFVSKEQHEKEKENIRNSWRLGGEENQKLKTKILGLEGENKELTEQNTQLLVKLKESK